MPQEFPEFIAWRRSRGLLECSQSSGEAIPAGRIFLNPEKQVFGWWFNLTEVLSNPNFYMRFAWSML